jgi:ribosomal small subunit protein bTHX
MGKGDQSTRRGKIWRGTRGKTRRPIDKPKATVPQAPAARPAPRAPQSGRSS